MRDCDGRNFAMINPICPVYVDIRTGEGMKKFIAVAIILAFSAVAFAEETTAPGTTTPGTTTGTTEGKTEATKPMGHHKDMAHKGKMMKKHKKGEEKPTTETAPETK